MGVVDSPNTDQTNDTHTTTRRMIDIADDGRGVVNIKRDINTAIVKGSRQYPKVHTLWKNDLSIRNKRIKIPV